MKDWHELCFYIPNNFLKKMVLQFTAVLGILSIHPHNCNLPLPGAYYLFGTAWCFRCQKNHFKNSIAHAHSFKSRQLVGIYKSPLIMIICYFRLYCFVRGILTNPLRTCTHYDSETQLKLGLVSLF